LLWSQLTPWARTDVIRVRDVVVVRFIVPVVWLIRVMLSTTLP